MSNYPRAEISLSALRHNLSQIRKFAPKSKVISVIKADAYGHGVINAATALADSDAFAVARLAEGILLREHGFTQRIMLLEGVVTDEEYEIAARHDLSPVIHHLSQVQQLNALKLSKPLTFCWLMIDSGMHRLGIRPEQALATLQLLATSNNIDGDVGLMSHFANADMVGDKRNEAQLLHMLMLKQQADVKLCLSNSAAVISLPDSHQEWVRPGLMLYGISPFADRSAKTLGLKPVMQLKTRLIAVYPVMRGEEVGYGGDWTAMEPTLVGVASIGYGDGYSRHLSNQAKVEINGQQAPVIGRVSMDTICINLNGIKDAQTGDEVILWGTETLTVESVAELAQTIPYELVTVLCRRVHREVVDGES